MRGAYHRLYGEARADAAADWLLGELQEMAERMALTPGGPAAGRIILKPARPSAWPRCFFLEMPDEERGRLDAEVDAALSGPHRTSPARGLARG
jgi:hypothetical protein